MAKRQNDKGASKQTIKVVTASAALASGLLISAPCQAKETSVEARREALELRIKTVKEHLLKKLETNLDPMNMNSRPELSQAEIALAQWGNWGNWGNWNNWNNWRNWNNWSNWINW
jgi:hypothetical protein